MVCVDTDFLIDLSKREERAAARLRELGGRGNAIYTTTISMGEYYTGAYVHEIERRGLQRSESF